MTISLALFFVTTVCVWKPNSNPAFINSTHRFFLKSIDSHQLSVRSYGRIKKVARTIADLDGKEKIELSHIAEAIHYRCLDKPPVIAHKSKKANRKI